MEQWLIKNHGFRTVVSELSKKASGKCLMASSMKSVHECINYKAVGNFTTIYYKRDEEPKPKLRKLEVVNQLANNSRHHCKCERLTVSKTFRFRTLLNIQVAQKKVKIAFENADLSSRVELILSKIKYANKVVLNSHKEFLVFLSFKEKKMTDYFKIKCSRIKKKSSS
nr:hypothetical protein [Tanacetum cinerariifolium]